MRIGNTAADVRGFLQAEQIPRRVWGWPAAYNNYERAHFGTECPRCGALAYLCLSETGLAASAPHLERTLAAFFADDLEPIFDDETDDD